MEEQKEVTKEPVETEEQWVTRMKSICEVKIQNFLGFCETTTPAENILVDLTTKDQHTICHWKFTINKIDISGAFEIPRTEPGQEHTAIALNVAYSLALSAHPQGALINKIMNEIGLYAHPDASRNALPEVFLRALIGRTVLSSKIPRGQMAAAIAEMLHLDQNISEAFANLNPPRMRH